MKNLLVLGTGCPKCKKLHENVEQAAKEMGIEHEIHKVTDINAITGFGVMTTPALVVDDEVKVAGRVPTVDELKIIIG